jgi:hypothetical protein
MSTWADLQAVPIKHIWQELRSLRSQKVGRAAGGDRRATFNAALEQSEQLFTAASSVGTATQPILLFYGLSQLGRAVAAASNRVGKEYKLSGHGIKDGELQGAASQGLAQLIVQGLPNGSFPVVAKALDASPMSEPLPLGKIWGLLPDAERFMLPGSGGLQRLVLTPESSFDVPGVETARGQLSPLPLELQLSVTNPAGPRAPVEGTVIDKEKKVLGEFLADYPSLMGWSLPDPIQPIPYRRGFYGTQAYLDVSLLFPKTSDVDEESSLAGRGIEYHGENYVYPRLDRSMLPAHPLLLWWSVLFTLSRLARYEPNVWLKLTAVSEDASAVPIEYILGEATRAVPELALRAIIRCASDDA